MKFYKRLLHRILQKAKPFVKEDLPHQIIQKNHLRKVTAPLHDSREPAEKLALVEALRQSGGNQSQAARSLGINRVTVWNRMKKYGIDLRVVMTTK